MTTPVPSPSQMSSAPALYPIQAAKMNTTLPTALRDPTPPTVARKRGRRKGSRVEKNHKSSLLPRSSSRIASRTKDRHGQALTDTRPSLIVRLSIAGSMNSVPTHPSNHTKPSLIVRLPMAGGMKSVPTPPSNPSPKEVLLSSSRDMIAPTAAPNNTYHRAGQILSSGESIAPRSTSSAIPSARRGNTSVQAVQQRPGSSIAPTTIPRVRIISDAREALKQLIRARSSARISSLQADTPMQAIQYEPASHQESMYDPQLEQSAFRQPASHQASLYDQRPEQSAFVRRPAPYHQHGLPQQQAPRHQEGFNQRRRLPQEQSHGYQQGFNQHHEYPQTQPFDQPSAFQPAFQQQRHSNPTLQQNNDQAQREYEESRKRWQQSLWNDGGMM